MTKKKFWPVVVLFHGSLDPEPNTQARVLCKRLQSLLPDRRFEVAFLQFGKPGLKDVLDSLATESVRHATVVPAFLFKGAHVTRDVQQIIEQVRTQYTNFTVVTAEPFGACQQLAELIVTRLGDAERD